MRTSLLLSVLALMVAAPTALIACSHGEESTSSTEANATAAEPEEKGADEGGVCWETKDCAEGLLCKKRPTSHMPPGAVGMPVPSSTSTHPMPPGAVGMPLPPNTCQKPAPGEEGSTCRSSSECDRGLVCEQDVAGSSSGGGAHFPPGAMGMPIAPHGKCAKEASSSSSSGGPPPGALGLPIHP